MSNLEDAVKRLAAYSAGRAEAKVDDIGPKGGIKRVPAPDRISGLSDGSTLLYTDLKTVLAAVEQFDTILVKALTLPVLGDVEDELVKAVRDTHGSINDGVQAVYGEVLEMLALNLVLARAALAGDDPDEQLPVEGVWPPRAGDVWKDRDGDLWFAVDMNDGTDVPGIEFVSASGADHEDPDEVRRRWGPIGLVYRAQPEAAK